MSLAFKITYGLYVLCAVTDGKENGCMINTLMQQTSTPETFSVTVNKQNFTHDMIAKSKKCAVALLAESVKFDLIKNFGMQSGKTANKFDGAKWIVTKSGIKIPTDGVLGYYDMDVLDCVDMGSHTMFVLSPTDSVILTDETPLTYAYYHSHVKPKPTPAVSMQKEVWVCKICGYVHEGPLPTDFVCPICKHPASDFEKVTNGDNAENNNIENQKGEQIMKKYVCTVCGYVHEGDMPADFTCPLCGVGPELFEEVASEEEDAQNIEENQKGENNMAKYVCPVCGYVHEGDSAPAKCPQCGVDGSKFKKDEGTELVWAAEHVIGVGQGVPQDIYDGLKANFEGECTEVGMYLAMARVAHREGYPEIGLYWEKAAWEEAEHAAKFCEMLGELVTDSTKKNLEMRVAAENGATLGKFELAKRAKQENLDAIHDTVHEMARDEARHGKAFAGLLKRHFN